MGDGFKCFRYCGVFGNGIFSTIYLTYRVKTPKKSCFLKVELGNGLEFGRRKWTQEVRTNRFRGMTLIASRTTPTHLGFDRGSTWPEPRDACPSGFNARHCWDVKMAGLDR